MKLRVPQVGETAPNFTLPDIYGYQIELANAPKQAVLVFLRHLA
jgi:peroxiredoxin